MRGLLVGSPIDCLPVKPVGSPECDALARLGSGPPVIVERCSPGVAVLSVALLLSWMATDGWR